MKFMWFGVLLLAGQLVEELLFAPEGSARDLGWFTAVLGTSVLAAVVLFVWERVTSRGALRREALDPEG